MLLLPVKVAFLVVVLPPLGSELITQLHRHYLNKLDRFLEIMQTHLREVLWERARLQLQALHHLLLLVPFVAVESLAQHLFSELNLQVQLPPSEV